MFVALIRLPIRVAMAAEHRQQRPFGITDLGVGTAQMRRLERLGEVEGKVDRHQRVEGEREDTESRGPDPASPLSHSHSVVPANGGFDAGTTLSELKRAVECPPTRASVTGPPVADVYWI